MVASRWGSPGSASEHGGTLAGLVPIILGAAVGAGVRNEASIIFGTGYNKSGGLGYYGELGDGHRGRRRQRLHRPGVSGMAGHGFEVGMGGGCSAMIGGGVEIGRWQ